MRVRLRPNVYFVKQPMKVARAYAAAHPVNQGSNAGLGETGTVGYGCPSSQRYMYQGGCVAQCPPGTKGLYNGAYYCATLPTIKPHRGGRGLMGVSGWGDRYFDGGFGCLSCGGLGDVTGVATGQTVLWQAQVHTNGLTSVSTSEQAIQGQLGPALAQTQIKDSSDITTVAGFPFQLAIQGVSTLDRGSISDIQGDIDQAVGVGGLSINGTSSICLVGSPGCNALVQPAIGSGSDFLSGLGIGAGTVLLLGAVLFIVLAER